jgi:dephospho-CoA kinase
MYNNGVDMVSEPPEIIGLVGPIRSGKTTITKYLVERYGYTLASNSEVLRKILGDIGLDQSRDNLGMLGNSIFSIFGNDLIARYRVENLHLGRIVVDGIRYSEELMRYREVPEFRLLGVKASVDIRFERALLASEEFKDVELTRGKFDKMVFSRSELDVPGLLAEADKVIYNDDCIDRLLLEVDQAMQGWIA